MKSKAKAGRHYATAECWDVVKETNPTCRESQGLNIEVNSRDKSYSRNAHWSSVVQFYESGHRNQVKMGE
jgi:hypothetical protein